MRNQLERLIYQRITILSIFLAINNFRAGRVSSSAGSWKATSCSTKKPAGFSVQNGIGSKATFVVWEGEDCRYRATIAKLWPEAVSGSGGVHSPPGACRAKRHHLLNSIKIRSQSQYVLYSPTTVRFTTVRIIATQAM